MSEPYLSCLLDMRRIQTCNSLLTIVLISSLVGREILSILILLGAFVLGKTDLISWDCFGNRVVFLYQKRCTVLLIQSLLPFQM